MKTFVFVVLMAVVATTWAEQCVDKQTKIAEDGCNRCNCANGLWICTQIACPSHHQHRRQAECQPGETKKVECNMCRCTNGVFSCTRLACPPTPPSRRRRRQVQTTDNCRPGATFQDRCNSCRCLPDGKSAACTLRLCP